MRKVARISAASLTVPQGSKIGKVDELLHIPFPFRHVSEARIRVVEQ